MRVPAFVAAFIVMLDQSVAAQERTAGADTAAGWNSPAVLELMSRARVRRQQPRGDTALRNYSAKAGGHIYFYLDRQQGDERTLVKVDQVALEMYWAAPNLTKQRIVGLRDESRLPNRMYYHLDHLTVVQNGFGDVIRLGDGDEVHDVPHPAAQFSDTIYDYRLSDTQTFSFVGQPRVDVFNVQVRPRNYNRSALIGTISIDQASADIVRMTFTFTPASYVDRRLDYINISLDNGLWSGRYWLPNEQYVEIRRQIPELDFVAGAVIKGRLRMYDYKFNQDLPRSLFYGPLVEARPKAEREAFAFEEGIFAGLDREGLTPPPQVQELRAQALELVRRKKLSGLPKFRLHVPNASSVMRYNRAEGLQVGAGFSYSPGGPLRYEGLAGYAFAVQHPTASLALRHENDAGLRLNARGFLNTVRDIGWRTGMPGALNTLTTAFAGADYLDPYYASGGELEAIKPWRTDGEIGLRVSVEQQRSAQLEFAESAFGAHELRPVRPISDGTVASLQASLSNTWQLREHYDLSLNTSIEGGLFDGTAYVRPIAQLGLTWTSASRVTSLTGGVSAGLTTNDAPLQKLFLLGGRGTLPGYPYRNFTGNAFWLLEAEATREVLQPWIRLRAGAAYGGVNTVSVLPPLWPQPDQNTGVSVSVGLGLIYDIIRLDLARGGSRSPRLIFSVKPDLWDMF